MSAYIVGNNTIGSELSVVIVPSIATIRYSYQWYRSSIYDSDYEPIPSATTSHYIIRNNDVFIKCIVYDESNDIESNVLVVSKVDLSNLTNQRVNETNIDIGGGLDYNYPVSAVSGASNTINDVGRINQSIQLILSTAYGEVPMMPSLGSNLHQYIFESIDDDLLGMIEQEVESALSDQEPRINVEEVIAEYIEDEGQDHIIYVTIEYSLVGTNVTSSYIYKIPAGDEEGGDIYE